MEEMQEVQGLQDTAPRTLTTAPPYDVQADAHVDEDKEGLKDKYNEMAEAMMNSILEEFWERLLRPLDLNEGLAQQAPPVPQTTIEECDDGVARPAAPPTPAP